MADYELRAEVYCTLQIEGVHNWPECPYDEVSYLRNLHRHVFYIKAHKAVNHDDRDCEFIMLKHEIANFLHQQYFKDKYNLHVFGRMSCEEIARELIEEFELSRCEVSEDNENGAILTVERTCAKCVDSSDDFSTGLPGLNQNHFK